MQNCRLERTGLAIPCRTGGLTGPSTDVGHQESVGLVVGQVWNRTDLFLRSTGAQLAGHSHLLLTLGPLRLGSFSSLAMLWNVGQPEEWCLFSSIFYILSNILGGSQEWCIWWSIFYQSSYGSWESQDWCLSSSIFNILSYGSWVS